MENELALLIPISTVIGAFVMVIYLRRYANTERMAMIEKGINPDLLKRNIDTSWSLRSALLLMGAGLGLLCGYFLDQNYNMQEVAYFSMILLFGGLGLIASYFIEEKKNNARKPD